jgi:hypothetical protein
VPTVSKAIEVLDIHKVRLRNTPSICLAAIDMETSLPLNIFNYIKSAKPFLDAQPIYY